MTDEEGPCPCWAEVSLHGGHCCFDRVDEVTGMCLCADSHLVEGMAILTAYRRSVEDEGTVTSDG